MPYGPEYRVQPPNLDRLGKLAEGTGGRLFAGDDPEAALREILAEEGGDPVRKPIWPYLVVAGLLLFLVDIALRQIGWLPREQEEEAMGA